MTVTAPGVYTLSEDEYHADPVPAWSLSASGARRLLPPSCPARYRWERDHPPEPTSAMDLGTAAHQLVLGAGAEMEVIDARDWRTKDARELRDKAHAAGRTPLLTHEWEQVEAMAAAIRAHPVAAALLDPETGQPEQSLVWQDDLTGVWLRSRLDWLPHPDGGRMIVTDYKTCRAADYDSLSRSMHGYGYHLQAAWYLEAVRALDLAADPAFVLLAQEKEPPYLVVVAEPDPYALRVGSRLMRQAIDTFAACVEADHWPGYTDDVLSLSLPAWAARRHEDEGIA